MTSELARPRGSPDPADPHPAESPAGASDFAPYLSRMQLERLVRSGAPRTQPADEVVAGALLFLDAVGFTALTERFAERGRLGAEQIADTLDAYFAPLLEIIEQHGGDVLHFAGDALLVFWASPPGAVDGLETSLTAAAACALAVQRRVRDVEPAHDARLSFRASLAAGEVRALEVGGLNGRWLQLVAGQPLEEIRAAHAASRPGCVVLAERTLDRLPSTRVQAQPLGAGWFELSALTRRFDAVAASAVAAPPEIDRVLRGYVPRAAADGAASGQADLLGEFRRVTVVIANLAPPRAARAGGGAHDVEVLQRAARAAQEEVERFEGEIDQLLEVDKGTELIIAFGLPGSAHAEDPVRAVLAARALEARFRALGLEPAIGVATGTVFCGIHGSPRRRQYSLLGSTINLAARLSGEATGRGVLCDDATRAAAARRIAFSPAGATVLKGFDAPLPLFTAGEPLAAPGAALATLALVGRAREVELLDRALAALTSERRGAIIIIEAEAGLGKSALLERTSRQAASAGVAVATGFADPLERGTAYFAFRPLVRAWFGITPGMNSEEARARVLDALRDSPDHLPLAPLLGTVLALELPDTELTAQMRGQVRAENLQRVLHHVASMRLSVPSVLCLEDVHWMDSASWAFIATLARDFDTVLFVLSSRAGGDEAEEYDALKRRATVLALAPLSREDTAATIRELLGVTDVADDVTALVAARAEGNPFYIREITRSLRESGALHVVDGRCERGDTGAGGDPLPATLEGVLTARIDHLPPGPKLTLKVAAVIGRAFDLQVLRDVHPTPSTISELEVWLDQLLSAELIVADATIAGATHRFQHALTQEAAYGLQPFAQRRGYHGAAAVALERLNAPNIAPVQARIAHHFRMAELPARAIPHLAGAGRQALDSYACREAVEFLRDALALDRDVRGDLRTDAQRAEWSRLLAQAWYSLNAYDDAQDGYERAIRYTGWPVPSGASGALRVLPPLLAARVRGHGHGAHLTGESRVLALEALRAMTELGTVHLWKGDQARWANNALTMTRLADALGDAPESAFALIQFASLLTVIGLRRRADRESARAVTIAERSGDLLQIVSCNIGRGMIVTSQGRPLVAIEPLRRAHAVAEDLRAGLWKHRSKFQLGEALLWLGRFAEAGRSYEEAAAVSIAAEPHVTGFANAMVACTLLHRGRIDDALTLLEGPTCLPYVRESPAALSIVCALGVLADARLQAGDRAGALDAVRQAEAAVSPRDDGTAGFFISVIGHSAIAAVCLELACGAPPAEAAALAAQLDRTFKRLRKIARIHPGARPRVERLIALRDLLHERPAKAVKRLRSALTAAESAAMPWEIGKAAHALADLVDPADRESLRSRARAAFLSTDTADTTGPAQSFTQP